MIELSCDQVQEASTEYALGILPLSEAASVSAHILECPDCRGQVDQIREIGDELLDLIPDAEPPLGFDERVLSAVSPRRGGRPTKLRLVVAGAAAAVIAAAGVTAATLTGKHPAHPAELAAALQEGNRSVGSVYVGGHPTWVSMTVSHVALTGTVSCQLVTTEGKVTTIGSFQLVDGSGTWSAPDPGGTSHLAGARLVSSTGEVIASGAFRAG